LTRLPALALAVLALLPLLNLLGLPDLTVDLGILPCLHFRIDRRHRPDLSLAATLTAQHFEQKLKLCGIDPLRSPPDLLPAKLCHQELQILVLRRTASRAATKNSNASSTLPSVNSACADSRICRSAEGSPVLVPRLSRRSRFGSWPAHRHHPRDLRRSRSRSASRFCWLSSSMVSHICDQASTASRTSRSCVRGM
jgi:hypothetical protein